ncbi:hypothetical protein KIH41_02635 [Litoribacter ruber]|uniref:HPt domain-containing protein n=1 Tax=Litoribacter ruber TaxID=702568 RepID=A0AAP2CJ97_9BACT|nr:MULTISPECIES: hypothetical protein [Litoribacter]MBS9525766.1 hypothetical protein [Litoribacter alkaliphilus]MBT0810177.1 hypothetical protein [Litoribacter ruber]
MGNNSTNLDYQLVLEMAEGDKEFENELLDAIITSVQDLKEKYSTGLVNADDEMIMQARHKIKPTLALFGLERLTEILEEGKVIIESQGFNASGIHPHKEEFMLATGELLEELYGIRQSV